MKKSISYGQTFEPVNGRLNDPCYLEVPILPGRGCAVFMHILNEYT